MKFHPMFDQALVEIITNDPLAIIVILRNKSIYSWQRMFEQRLLSCFTTANLDDSYMHRIVLLDQMSHEDYMTVLCSMSVNLDPFPFGGGVTLTDSMFCGVPFVTIPSLQSVHKLGAGIANRLNLSDYAAHTLKEYVSKSIRFAEHHRRNSNISDQDSHHVDVVDEWRTFLKRVVML